MGKGGGCLPSKSKATLLPDHGAPVPVIHRSPSINDQSDEKSPKVKRKLRIFIVFYSTYGHIETLARKLKKGVDAVEGCEGFLYRVPETLSTDVLEQMKVPVKEGDIPVISAEQLVEADGLLFGFPTRFGSMAAQMKAFFDSTGALWREQKLAGVPAGFFVSSGTQGGGQETTAWTAITQLAHHGMIYVPIGYTYTFGAGMFGTDSLQGGSPYGAGVYSGDGTRKPTQHELDLAQYQGNYMALLVHTLSSSL